MWDEEKFFKDFREESEQIEPEPEFVKKMLLLAEKEERKVIDFRKGYRFAAVAAALLLCVVGFRMFPFQSTGDVEMEEMDLHANIIATESQEGVFGTIEAISDKALEELKEGLAASDSQVLEVGGEVLTEEEIEDLTDKVNSAKWLQEKEVEGEVIEYQIQRESGEVLDFAIVSESYLLLKDGEKVYSIE